MFYIHFATPAIGRWLVFLQVMKLYVHHFIKKNKQLGKLSNLILVAIISCFIVI